MVKSVSRADIWPKFYFIITLKFLGLFSAVARLDLLGGGGGRGDHERRSRKLLGGFPLKYLKYRVSDIAFSAFREHSFPALFK